jgi:hypothetical protein
MTDDEVWIVEGLVCSLLDAREFIAQKDQSMLGAQLCSQIDEMVQTAKHRIRVTADPREAKPV